MIIKNIQILRALAANSVVLSHIVNIEQKYGQGLQLLPIAFKGGDYGVDLFFVISGFIMAIISRNSWREFLFSRITRIYPPYWFYTSLVFIMSFLNPSIVNSSYQGKPMVWKSYLLIPDATPPLLNVGWTLVHEMYFYIGFSFIIGIGITLKRGLLFWSILLIGVAFFNDSIRTISPFTKIIFSPMTMEFIFGAFIGYLVRNGIRSFALPALICGTIALSLAIVYCGDMHRSWITVILVGIPCAMLVYGSANTNFQREFFVTRLLVRLGDASYSTYLSHILVLSVIGRVIALLPIHNWYTETLLVVMGFIASNVFGVLSYHFIEIPLTRFCRQLFQNKSVTAVS